jgi:hypothetical protein
MMTIGDSVIRKSSVGAVLLCCTATLILGQEKKLKPAEVPPAISAAATKRFPNAQVSNWSREAEDGKTTYEASVSDASGKRDAVFSEDGSLVAIEESVAVSDLPAQVKDAVLAKYPHATLRKAEKISHDSQIDYEIDLAKAARKEITVSSNGKILKEE